ncbi:hypothetical protein [Delftia acidovorans]|uniref:Uncharacterized protein n=1 Tax=Delftia acidovorans TaxID=80866 RepID=A0AAJ2R7Y5_DELAC|nr:hypothetical protein [Delftia acidovorans]MDX4957250.1 hypothetical protein [Delftia acidovorans]
MSKTETQSEALRLADELMEPTLWPNDIRNLGAAELRRLGAENKALQAQLEASPKAQRVHTYRSQPDNVIAWQLGEACAAAAPGGDPIDRGLSLLQKLQERGYGIVSIEPKNGGAA